MTALKPIKVQAYQIVFWQLLIIVGLAVAVFLMRGTQNGLSTLLGGLAYWLPTLIFVWRVFARVTVRAVKQFTVAFFAGEALKLMASAVLFLLIIQYLPVLILPLLVGYIGAIVAFWIASVIYLNGNQGVSL